MVAGSSGRKWQRLQRGQRVKHGDAMGVGRAFENREAAEGRRQRLGEFPAMGREIGSDENAAMGLGGAGRSLRHRPQIEGVGPAGRDGLQHGA